MTSNQHPAAVDVEKLRAAAEKATQGEWRLGQSVAHQGFNIWLADVCSDITDPGANLCKEDAEHIAAANPSAIVAVLDRLAAAEATNDRYAEWRMTIADALGLPTGKDDGVAILIALGELKQAKEAAEKRAEEYRKALEEKHQRFIERDIKADRFMAALAGALMEKLNLSKENQALHQALVTILRGAQTQGAHTGMCWAEAAAIAEKALAGSTAVVRRSADSITANIVRNVRDYTEARKCECKILENGMPMECWRCIFLYYLAQLDAAQAPTAPVSTPIPGP